MRGLLSIFLVMVPALASAGAPVDLGMPVDCKAAKFTPETTICSREDLRAADAAVASAYSKLARMYRGEDLRTFDAGQRSWKVERNDCRNSPTADGYRGGEYGCLKERLSSRVAVLEGLLKEPAGLAGTVASYAFVEVWYLLKFARQYERKEVKVVGSVVQKDCNSVNSTSTGGRLRGQDGEIEIRFSALDSATRSFLCAKNPFSWWTGTVQLEAVQSYLHATQVLGRAL